MRWTMLIAIVGTLLLPRDVPCGVPGETCEIVGDDKRPCHLVQVEPFGIYLLESALHRDVGFSYRSRNDCY